MTPSGRPHSPREPPAGRALFEQGDAVALAVESRLSAAFSSTEDEQLREMLGRGIRALSERAAGPS